MDEAASYPPIDPSTFDLIIVGTGLPESILAASAAATGKTVLHLDPNPFYGSHFASLPLNELSSFLHSHPLYNSVKISSLSPSPLDPHKFNLDLAGPRVLFCSDSIVDLMLKSGASQYIEFKSVEASFIYSGEGELFPVPDSRSAIFRDSSLSLSEKTRLGGFFKLVEAHLRTDEADGGDENVSERKRISDEDLESPFVEFLNKMRLSAKIKSYGLISPLTSFC